MITTWIFPVGSQPNALHAPGKTERTIDFVNVYDMIKLNIAGLWEESNLICHDLDFNNTYLESRMPQNRIA